MKKIFTISLFLIFNAVLFAQIPGLLSYQGYITDANNIPRTGNVIITFKLYDAPSGGNLIWSEVDKTVIVEKGFFTTLLGTPTAFGSGVLFDKQYYLSLTPQGENEITPRIQLSSSAYAINAKSVEDGAITSVKLSDASVTTNKVAAAAITTDKIANSAITNAKLAAEIINGLMPVGTIIASGLTEAQFNQQMGNAGKWKLCNGQSCNPSTYRDLTGNSVVPDLRGFYLRGSGQNATRTMANGSNFNGGSLNSYQDDQFQGHWHKVAFSENDYPLYGVGSGSNLLNQYNAPLANIITPAQNLVGKDPVSGSAQGAPRTGAETRPASYSINYFIKINQ